ncbi:MAG: (Fe-S)-binding protein [Actinobacteria bacterium]|nr:(Fe-S)-binding protein [Actinomycetota bacterium]
MLAATKTRPVFWDFRPWLEALWYVLVTISIAVFAYGVWRSLHRYRQGRRTRDYGAALRRMPAVIRELAGQGLLRARNRLAGDAHTAVFYGFLVLFVGTVILLISHDLAQPFGLGFFHGNFYLGYSIVLDLFGVALIAGTVTFMVWRGLVRPPRLDYRAAAAGAGTPARAAGYGRGDWAFLWLLLIISVTGFMQEGVRIAMEHPGWDGFQPVGWLFAQPFEGASQATLAAVRHGLWWFHGLLAIAFVAAIPYTKATHMLQGVAALALRDPDAMRRLPPTAAEGAAGYATLRDFEAAHLVDLDACTKCGRCHAVCPATAVGMPLSPRDVVLDLRELARTESGRGPLALGALGGEPVVGEGGEQVRSAALWSCMQCNACVEVCPVGIEQAPIILEMRRGEVEKATIEPTLQQTLETIHKTGNSFGESKRRRGRWTKELDFTVPDARERPVEVLWFVGDYASFDPRNQRVTRTVAELLHRAGVDFGILFDGERNAGNDVRRVGEEGLFEHLVEANVAALGECTFETLMTSDPHSLNTLLNEYPDRDGRVVRHHTAILTELLAAGRLSPTRPLGARATYHDPCNLGRLNRGFEAPREVLAAAGCELHEMPRNRENSFCCGAGGGRIWMKDEFGAAERPSEARIREALSLGVELDYFAVSCPKDVTMYEDAVKTSGNEGRIEVREVAELLLDSLG